jgi:lipopolysaccharide biosynthesis glycosyltransferase
MYNILLACDNLYYDRWAKNCIKSIQRFAPWINITVVVVNPNSIEEIANVRYVYDYFNFKNENSKIPYYQAVRFLKCADIFPNNELVMSIDCDTLLTRSFAKEHFISICNNIHVLQHHKVQRWMAGLVTYGRDNIFRNLLKERLLELPIEDWIYGRDQEILNSLSNTFYYNKLKVGDWMSFGKGRGKFLTLKGDQKFTEKYLTNYANNL